MYPTESNSPHQTFTNAPAWLPHYTPNHLRKSPTNISYTPAGVCVTISYRTHTDVDLAALFDAGCRSIHVQMAYGTHEQLQRFMLAVNTAIASHFLRKPRAIPISRCIELRGQTMRVGRLHNDKNFVQLHTDRLVFVTANKAYENCSTSHVIYVRNLDRYMKCMCCNDIIVIGRQNHIQLRIVKLSVGIQTIECCVIRAEVRLESYMEVIWSNCRAELATALLTADELDDCAFAVECDADFVVVPEVLTVAYVRALRAELLAVGKMRCKESPKLLCEIVTENLDKTGALKQNQIMDMVLTCDGLWFDRNKTTEFSATDRLLVFCAHVHLKPVIIAMNRSLESMEGHSVDFYESDHNPDVGQPILHNLEYQHQLSVAVKAAHQTNDKQCDLDSVSAIIDCSVRATLQLNAQMMICATTDGRLPIRLAHARPRCPILTVVDQRHLARALTIYKNLLPVVYVQCGQSEDDALTVIERRLQFGLDWAKEMGALFVGDLVVYCYDHFEGVSGIDAVTSYHISYVSEGVTEFSMRIQNRL